MSNELKGTSENVIRRTSSLLDRLTRIGRFIANLLEYPSEAWDWSKYPEDSGYAAALLRWNRNIKRGPEK